MNAAEELQTSDERSKSAAPGDSLLAFFLLAYALMWACFISVAIAIPANTLAGRALVLLGAFAPSIAAVALTARREGSAAMNALLTPVVKWRVAGRWYVFAVTYMAAIKLAAALIQRLITGAWPRFGQESLAVVALGVVISAPFQAGEEIGWRGYALPRMAGRWGLGPASILLGVIWALWHLPQFFIRGADTYGQSIFVFAIGVTAISVALAWLWERTGQSLLLPMLLHSAINNTKDIVPSGTASGASVFGWHASLVGWITAMLLWICAIYFLKDMAKKRLALQS